MNNEKLKSSIKVGDTVMVISGGNKKKRPNKGQVGKVISVAGANNDRVVVEGLNLLTKHQRAAGPEKPGGKIRKESPIHVSNVMYYVEALKKTVRIRHKRLTDGTKVRGYLDPKSKEFVQIVEAGK